MGIRHDDSSQSPLTVVLFKIQSLHTLIVHYFEIPPDDTFCLNLAECDSI